MSNTGAAASASDDWSGTEAVPFHRGYQVGRPGRKLLALWGLLLMAGFALAWSLEPDPRGFGTHQRLGLPPCSFRLLLGIDCPSCGSTTSFSYFVRGEWLRAAECNLSAFGLALACAAMIPWSFYSSWTGRLWGVRRPEVALAWGLGLFCAVSLGQWSIRIALAWASA